MLPLLLALSASTPTAAPDCPTCIVPATPNMSRMFRSPDVCAGPAVQPFYKHPRVCPVAVCPCEETGTQLAARTNAWVKEFHCPAFVPVPRFDADGHPVAGDGLVIYEGMRLTVDPDTGAYEVTFTATTPDMLVTLRLQLTFIQYDGLVPVRQYTLTLPPIRMEMPRDARPGDPVNKTFHIAHRGQSTLFANPARAGVYTAGPATNEKCPPPALIDCRWEVKRDGTARFGTPVAIEDPTR